MHKDLRNKAYVEWKDFLRRSESDSICKIQDYENRKLVQVVNIANLTDGYKKHFKNHDVDVTKIKTTSDIVNLPFIDKTIMAKNIKDYVCNSDPKLYITTGGSTGIPFGFYRTKSEFAKELASKAHQYERIGWSENDRQMVFRGIPIKKKCNYQLYRSMNELRFSSYYINKNNIEKYVDKISKYRPQWLRCYPSSGYAFAKLIDECGLSIPQMNGVLCASENLYDFQKSKMQATFNCRIFSHYGHYELSVLAGFCEYTDDYHVLPYYGYAELVDKNNKIVEKEGEIGEIVATSFIMETTPFIRYRTNDLAVYKSNMCKKCNRPYQTWSKIDGRIQEYIVTKDNRYVSMTAINMHDNTFDGITQFQFKQDVAGELVFTYVADKVISVEKKQKIVNSLSSKIGNDNNVYFVKVNEIPLTKRGKHRFLIQNMKLGFENYDIRQ